MKDRTTLEEHETVIEEFKRVSVKAGEPIPYALVQKLDGINNQVEQNHAKMIQEELIKMQSRI